ncbi:MAG: heavy metal translocating P-type ATPase, partial [Gemmatimonadaceae bacterium]
RLADAGAEPQDREVAATDATSGAGDEPKASWYSRNHDLAWSLIAGVALVAGWLVDRGTDGLPWAALGLYLLAYFSGARDNVAHLIKDLRRGKFRFNIDLLMVVAAIGAAALGEWAEGALLLFLFSLGHALEHYAMGRARNAIKALGSLVPNTAIIRRGGRDTSTPIEQVKKGDIAVAKPGERLPVDGIVREGQSGVNQAPITGESIPVDKVPGDQVFAGSVNGEGVLLIEVSAAVGDRTLDRVIKLVADASTQKAPTQQFTDRFQRWFVPAVLIGDVLLIVVPPLLGISTWSESFYRGMAMLVAASPCALALGTPAAVLAGIAQAARNGVLIKGGAHLEALGSIDVFAMDKTGTITRGEPSVTDLAPEANVTEDMLVSAAAAVERSSQHPLAKAVVNEAERRNVEIAVATDVASVTGKGIRAQVGGSTVEVGKSSMFTEAGSSPPATVQASTARLEAAGRSTMVVRIVGGTPEWLGVIGVADQPREGVATTLNALRAIGVKKIVMLTGDNAGVGAAVAKSVGIDDVRAGLMPEDKVTAIKALAEQGQVAMIGDGVNDAPALAHATVGIAMGGAGTAATLETADVALMGDDLSKLPFAVSLSRQARRVIRQNLYLSLAVIAALVVATVMGWARIGPVVIVHEGSTLLVIANALRLLAFKGPRAGLS